MLQNHRKGTDFSTNNQKKTQKKSQTCHIFLIRIGYRMQKWQSLVITKICQYWQL